MFRHLVVPIDGSTASFDAVAVASRMCAAVDGRLDAFTVVDHAGDKRRAQIALERGIERLRPLPVEPTHEVLAGNSVVDSLTRLVESTLGAMVVMSSHGHARSAAVLGSTTDEVLRRMFGPVIVVGPHCDVEVAGALDGTYVVPLDGSSHADCVLPIVAAWTVEFCGTPWLVAAVDEAIPRAPDVVDSGYVRHRAGELRRRIDREVEYEALHREHPARAIVDFAISERASLIFLSTHGRSGLGRLRTGSVAIDVVRRSHCPVVLFQPPALAPARRDAVASTSTIAQAGGEPPVWSRAWCEQFGPDAAASPLATARRTPATSRR